MSFIHSPKIVTNNLIMYFDASNIKGYNSGSITMVDLSGNFNSASLQNGAMGSGSGYISFDGVDDIALTPISLWNIPGTSSFSMECWVKIPSFPQPTPSPNVYGRTDKNGVLFGSTYYCGTALYWTGHASGTSCNIYGYIRGNDASRSTTGYSMAINTWYQFTLVNSSMLTLYVNGIQYSSVSGATQDYNYSLGNSAGNIGISKSQIDGGGTSNYSPLQCDVAICKIYNKSLLSDEVLQNFNAAKWRFGL